MSICNRLFEMLESSKREQKELAQYLGISQTTITNWKTRKTDPPAKFIIPICEFFGVSIEMLLTGDERYKLRLQNVLSDDLMFIADRWEHLDADWKMIVKGKICEAYKEMMNTESASIAKSS